jgi:glycerol-3-phosphate dehydrogenase
MCVENAVAALETGNATVLNHAAVTHFLHDGNTLTGVVFEDTFTGKRYPVGGNVIINAAGPWVDAVLQQVGIVTGAPQARRIGGTQGSHIVVRRFAGGPDTALYVEARSDGRPFFIIPWLDDDYLIGTTDLRFEGEPDQAVADDDEIAYLLTETNTVLPGARLTENDVLYSYSGIRPLPYTEGKSAGAITRKHWILDHAHEGRHPVRGLVSIIGGKLTTYRNLAEEAVDYCVRAYQLTLPNGAPVPASSTRHTPLPGGVGIQDLNAYKQAEIPAARQRYAVPDAVIDHLIDRYGSRYQDVLHLLEENPAWKQPISDNSPDIAAQVIYAVRRELALTVDDVLLRRLQSGFDAQRGLDALDMVTRLMAEELRWSAQRIHEEQAAYRQYLATRTRMETSQPKTSIQ